MYYLIFNYIEHEYTDKKKAETHLCFFMLNIQYNLTLKTLFQARFDELI